MGYRHPHEPSAVLRLEAQVLSLKMSGLGVLSNLSHGVLSPLVGWQGIINCLSVFGSNSILLSEISLLDDRVGKLLVRLMSGDKRKTHGKELGGIVMQVIPLSLSHDSSIEFPNLIVLASLALVGPMRPSTDDIGGGLVRCLRYRFTREGGRG